MGAITIRKLDEKIIAGLKRRAKAHGRSMEEEARRVLETAARTPEPARAEPDMAALKALEAERQALIGPDGRMRPGPAYADFLRRWRTATFGDRVFPDSTPLLRELREEDPTAWSGE